MKTIALFNNKGGVGSTTLLYHLAWMFSDLGLRTVAVDLDPQSNLTSMFLSEGRLDELWEGPATGHTIVNAVAPLLEQGTGDVAQPHSEIITPNLALVPGDLDLARMEDRLSAQWPKCLEGIPRAFRITTALHRVVHLAADRFHADIALLDVGPNLGALNRCALIAADHIAVTLAPDLLSLQGLRSLGPALNEWRKGWARRLEKAPASLTDLPKGLMQPAGYVVLQDAVRQTRTVSAYLRRAQRIPSEYRTAILGLDAGPAGLTPEQDPNCLAQLKHYPSLMPMALQAGKPIFHLKPADGAIGAHVAAVAQCGKDFRRLALRLAQGAALALPSNPEA